MGTPSEENWESGNVFLVRIVFRVSTEDTRKPFIHINDGLNQEYTAGFTDNRGSVTVAVDVDRQNISDETVLVMLEDLRVNVDESVPKIQESAGIGVLGNSTSSCFPRVLRRKGGTKNHWLDNQNEE